MSIISIVAAVLAAAGPSITVPAFTAYLEPNPDAASVSERSGITDWKDGAQHISWFGSFKSAGDVTPIVHITLPAGASAKYRLTAVGQSSTVELKGSGQPATAVFKSVHINRPGYVRFQLDGLSKTGSDFGQITDLQLDGGPVETAHFNMKERRNAASVHLVYPLDGNQQVSAFYNEVTVKADPIWSYYMATGFRRGYFGIQVNSPTERRIIFSVWDSGNEGVDRNKVADDDKVQLLAKGDGVFAGGFGNEGTGGHSHLVYPWKTGSTYRFLVTAIPDGTHTVYTGWFYFPEKQHWGIIARFRAPKDGNALRGLYSFNENFGGANGELQRLAEFGNQWVRTMDGKWVEITQAKFSHDGTGKADRLDYASGVVNGKFFLSNGGFIANGVKYGDPMTRAATGKAPADITEAMLNGQAK